ncbi:SGNH/GDSL hydrolase family protein [Brachybacterium sp. GCM10030267]|uniref:SGNH/GDSL hydrolase family protein n=1 Tax=Brachybacterium sp. GCM10030267 TaxID=3273381 RepID=UPI00360EECBF
MGTAIRLSQRQARDHAAYWARARAESGEITYLALGDSAAVGVGVDDPQQGYVGVVARRLAEATGRSVRTVNLAVSGARARDVLDDQIPCQTALPPPDHVTCVVGGNDVAWAPRFRAAEFAETMAAIAGALPANSVMGLVPRFGHWPYEGRARRANRIIRDRADLQGHPVAEIHAYTTRIPLLRSVSLLAGDYFHPNAAGHELWADAVWEALPR